MKYVVSSAKFKTLKEAEQQIQKWHKTDDLCPEARVYKIKEEYKPVVKLIKVKK